MGGPVERQWLLLLALAVSLWPSIAAAGPTLAEPPEHAVGDWWSVRVVDRAGGVHEGTIAVAAVDESTITIGTGDPHLLAVLLADHYPAIGALDRVSLAFDSHGKPFETVRFPLVVGASWPIDFVGYRGQAEVVAVEGGQAEIVYRVAGRQDPDATAVYDASLGFLKSMDIHGYSTFEVLGSGRGHACTVQVPLNADVVVEEMQRSSGVPTADTGALRRVDVASAAAQAVVMVSVGGASGTHMQRVMGPDGQEVFESVAPHDTQRYRQRYEMTGPPGGTWTMMGSVVGAGIAMVEVIAFDIALYDLGQGTAPDCSSPSQPLQDSAFNSDLGSPGAAFARTFYSVGLLTLLLAAVVHHRRRWLPLLPLYAKIPRDKLLDHPLRHDIVELLRQDPGLTTQEIRERLGVAWGTMVHHLATLERAGIVVAVAWGRQRDWFIAADGPPTFRLRRSALRRAAPRAVYDAVDAAPGVTVRALARTLGLSHSTVLFHVRRLQDAGLLTVRPEAGRIRLFTSSRVGER